MTDTQNGHLSDEQITWAVVDQEELPELAKEHLSHCDLCSSKVSALKESLSSMGYLATKSVSPPPPRLITDKKTTHLPLLDMIFGLRHRGLAVALAGILLVIVCGGLFVQQYTHEKQMAFLREEVLSDITLMAEVDQLIENPLPHLYKELSGEESLATDKDFIDFIVPDDFDGRDSAGNA